MTIGFKFMSDKSGGCCVSFTSDILFAYYHCVEQKIHKIIRGVLLLAFSGVLLAHSFFEFLPLVSTQTAFVLSFFGAIIGFVVFLRAFFWDGPAAIKLYGCIATEGFDDYVRKNIETLENFMNPDNIRLMMIQEKQLKRAQRILCTAEYLLELSEELSEVHDLDEIIELLNDNAKPYGFIIQQLKNGDF